jgi:hypothetical protein
MELYLHSPNTPSWLKKAQRLYFGTIYKIPNIFRVIESRRMRQAGYNRHGIHYIYVTR